VNDRSGQVWWARQNRITADFEPCVVLGTKNNTGPSGTWWILRPLERLGEDGAEFGSYESVFCHVELGGEDAWLKTRIA